MIEKMALDLGVYRYAEEPLQQYHSRVIYSAMSCWIKTIALDQPVGYKGEAPLGVTRRHIFDRSRAVLDTMIKMFPETKEWFDLSEDNDSPINLIRTRLINHGDLLNAGFGSNLVLSTVHSEQITSNIETIYGKTLEEGLSYSGVSSIRHKEAIISMPERENVRAWLKRFLNDVSWSHDLPDTGQMQYFNPFSATKNNYEAWQESIGNPINNIVLARTSINANSHSYYLLKSDEKLVHRIDPFLQEQGCHTRIICALRSLAQNNTSASVRRFSDHIKLHFNAILPLYESVQVENYAWPVRSINDRLEWEMDYEIWNYLKPHIEALDILITEEEHG